MIGEVREQGCQVLVLCHLAQQLPCQLLARHLQLGLGWPLVDELAQQGFYQYVGTFDVLWRDVPFDAEQATSAQCIYPGIDAIRQPAAVPQFIHQA
ncbi:hypothetical protein D3C76_1360690 [compost metagenome]